MNEGFCTSVLRALREINMNERDRARAEDGVRKSAAIIELFAGMFGGNAKQPEQRS